LRNERNSRFHHGAERDFSSDGQMFRMASMYEHRFNGVASSNGQPIPVEQLFREGLFELQTDFNGVMKKVVTQIDRLYDMLFLRFESRFSTKLRERNVDSAE
jgi:hypothetical protein